MATDFSPYLASTACIDSDHTAVRARAAGFTPPQEQLAFPVPAPEERALPEIWPQPLPQVVASLTGSATVQDVAAHLPDVEMLPVRT